MKDIQLSATIFTKYFCILRSLVSLHGSLRFLAFSNVLGGMLYGEQTTANYAINDIPVKVALISPYLEALNAGASTAMEEYKSFLTRCELEKKKFLEVRSSFVDSGYWT